jgi:predicted transglutaminase-like protease
MDFFKLNSKIEYYWQRFFGNCPSSDDLEDNGVKELARRLKAESQKQTLTNVLEWQEKNINFWFERYKITLFFYLFIFVIIPFAPLFSIPLFRNIVLTLYFLLILITIFLTVLGITALMIKSYRKLSIMQIRYVFKFDMPVKLLLEHKFGVCRDYAKLTFCLLNNIYPNSKICFIKIIGHVATGIFVDGQLYILDQRLPIKTIKGWNKRNKSKMQAYVLKDKSMHEEPINVEVINVNIEKLKAELSKRLNLSQNGADKEISELSIKWKQGVLYYEDDEFVNYSLVRWLKNKISDEMLDLTQICKLEISQNKEDLYFKITYVPST